MGNIIILMNKGVTKMAETFVSTQKLTGHYLNQFSTLAIVYGISKPIFIEHGCHDVYFF